MVKHIVIWDFADGFTAQEQKEHAAKIKTELETFVQKLEKVQYFKFVTDPLAASNGALMVDSVFEDMDAFKTYLNHPEHLKIAEYIKKVTKNRRCMDYED